MRRNRFARQNRGLPFPSSTSIQERRAFFGCDMNTWEFEIREKRPISQHIDRQELATSVHGITRRGRFGCGLAALYYIRQNLVFLRGFSENSFASLINRARARRRARARKAIKPY